MWPWPRRLRPICQRCSGRGACGAAAVAPSDSPVGQAARGSETMAVHAGGYRTSYALPLILRLRRCGVAATRPWARAARCSETMAVPAGGSAAWPLIGRWLVASDGVGLIAG